LVDRIEFVDDRPPRLRTGPSRALVRGVLTATIAVLGLAALVHVGCYVLLVVNRTTLLPWPVVWVAIVLAALAWLAAIVVAIAAVVVLTNWLIARRAEAFHRRGIDDPRRRSRLLAGCLVPLVNLLWAPVFVLELAIAESRLSLLRRYIVTWWLVWVASTAVCVYASVGVVALATGLATGAQTIADNTEATTIGYLVGMVAAILAMQVVDAFERKPAERQARRWLVVPDESVGHLTPEPAAALNVARAPDPNLTVESEGQNPAALAV
jgi:hypothetical protein